MLETDSQARDALRDLSSETERDTCHSFVPENPSSHFRIFIYRPVAALLCVITPLSRDEYQPVM